MQLLKNRHLVIAMLVTPVLAMIAWFATDYAVSEKPHAARAGNSYELVARSNCRYQSGRCTLHNGDVELDVMSRRIDDSHVELSLHAGLPVRAALAAFAEGKADTAPMAMQPDPDDAARWIAVLGLTDPERDRLRVSVNIDGSLYYAETSAVFVDYESSFPREHFPQ